MFLLIDPAIPYPLWRLMMASIYLIMTATGTLFSRCIGMYTGARYNHVSLCLDSGMNEFYSFGRKIHWFPLIGGFVVEHIDSGVFKAFGDTTCAIYRLEVSEAKYEKMVSEINIFIQNKKVYGYNLVGLIGVIFNIPMKRKNKYFCTQFVASMLQKSGIHDFGKDTSLVTPQDFYGIMRLEAVYEGRLHDLDKSRPMAVNTAAVN
jgi:hypothetical protein